MAGGGVKEFYMNWTAELFLQTLSVSFRFSRDSTQDLSDILLIFVG